MADDQHSFRRFLPTIRASQLARLEPEPLEYIDGHNLFIKGELNYLAGDGAAGKTTIALQLAVAVGLSLNSFPSPSSWLGRPVNLRGPVMFVSAEERKGVLHRKLLEICAADAIDLADLSSLHLHDLMDEDSPVMMESGAKGKGMKTTPLFAGMMNSAELIRPSLMILDNRAQMILGDEMDRAVAVGVGNTFRRICGKFDTSIIMLVHPSRAGMQLGASGTTSWNNTGRNTVLMGKPPADANGEPPDSGLRQLTVPKANYGPMDRAVNLKWTAGTYVCTDKAPRAGADIGKGAKAERVFLKLLAVAMERGNRVNDTKNSPYYAPDVFAEMEREGVNKREFQQAMERLWQAGKIEPEIVNPGTTREKRWLRPAKEG